MNLPLRSLFVFIAAATTLLTQCGRTAEVPVDFVGRWTTDKPTYTGRFFEITTESVVIGAGGSNVQTSMITGIEKRAEKYEVLYTIHYSARGVEDNLSFYYEPEQGGVIRLKNRNGIEWKRTEDKTE